MKFLPGFRTGDDMEKKVAVLAVLLVSVLCVLIFFDSQPSPESIMADFHRAEGRSEDMIMDPLIMHSSRIKNRVIEEIKDPGMDKRRYAIAFLGNDRIREAIPALETIVNSESEQEYFRGDALESIVMIDEARGRALAKSYSTRQDYLGHVARRSLDDSYKNPRRTKMDAWLDRFF